MSSSVSFAFVWASAALALLVALGAGLAAWWAAHRRATGTARWRPRAARHPLPTALLGIALAGLAGVGAFAEISADWQAGDLEALDRQVNAAFRALPPETTAWLRVVTRLADVPVLWAASLVGVAGLWARRFRWQAAALALAMGGGTLLMHGLKLHFGRARPDGAEALASYAFPSGHATGAMLLYGFAAWFVATRPWPTRSGRRWGRVALVMGLAALPVLVGLSRVGLSVHWVSDVLGGWVLGLAWLVVSLVGTWAVARRRAASPPPRQPPLSASAGEHL